MNYDLSIKIEACGMNKDNIILKLNGDVVEFIDEKLAENKEIKLTKIS